MNRLLAMVALALLSDIASACGDCEYEACDGVFNVICTCAPKGGCILKNPIPNPTPIKIPGTTNYSPVPLPRPMQNVVDGFSKVVSDQTEKLGADTLRTIRGAAGDSVSTLIKAKGDTITTIRKAGSDTVRTVERAGKDAVATYVKAWRDVSEQEKKTFHDAIDAEKAWVNYQKNELRSQRDAFDHAGTNLRNGKVIDAMWSLATEKPKASEKNFFQATQESTLINQAAASAAAIYGGPAGAAAYAAWHTYRATGDANLAFRAGIIAAATAEAGSSVAKMPSSTASELLKKSAMSGAAAGIATAAAGGDEKAIKDAFLKSAGTVLIQGGSEKAKSYSPKAVEVYNTIQCISARDIDCITNTTWARDAKGKVLYDKHGKPRIDTTKIDPKNYLGQWSSVDKNSPQGKALAFITDISKLPKSEAIPVLRGKWVLSWSLGKDHLIQYKKATVVLTYVGDKAPFISSATYGTFSEAKTTQSSATLKYVCPFMGFSRSVEVFRYPKKCVAVYKNGIAPPQIVWESSHELELCTSKAQQFVQHLADIGIACGTQH